MALRRWLMPALAWTFLLAPPGWAQSDNGSTASSSASSEDLNSFSVSAGTPGSWIRAALGRHQGLIAARVNAARNGEAPGVRSSGADGETEQTTNTSDASSSLSDLSTLLSQYSDSLDSFGSLSSLLSLLTGTSAGGTSDASTSKSSSRQQSQTSADSSSSDDETTSSDSETSTASSGTDNSTGFGGAIARLARASDLYPTTSSTGDERKFAVRLADSLMETFLSALALEFQSTEFIDFLKTALGPRILPSANDQNGKATANEGTTESADGV
jgi:hypothetical protein